MSRLRFPIIVLALLAASVRADEEEYCSRRLELDERLAVQYAKIAVAAKRLKAADLARAAFARAEALDPANEDVLSFEPEVEGKPKKRNARRIEKLAARLASTRLEEARARIELALWCDEEFLPDESVAEAREALSLAPGPIRFDENGALRDPKLGEIPLSVSIAVLDEYEVFLGKLVARDDIPDDLPWARAWQIETKHFLIRTNVSGRICRTVGRALEAAREVYRAETGFDVEERITVHILAKRKAYEELWEKRGEPAHPDNIGKCVGDFCAVDGSRSTREVVGVAIHEVAHGYFNLGHEASARKRGVCMPVWYAEGFATYCAGYGDDSLSFDDGVVVPSTARDAPLARFAEMVRCRSFRHLDEFLAHETGGAAFYYQAFAFYWFFKETEDAEAKRCFEKAVAALRGAALSKEDRVQKGKRIFVRCFGGDLEGLEKKFLAWAEAR